MRILPVVVGILVLSSAAGATASAATATSDATPVTLTVSVVTPDGTAVGGATIEASWDGGNRTVTTASNGKAFVDVPEGVDVSLDVESEEFIRNRPVVVEDATARDVTVEVAPKGRLTVAVVDSEGNPVEGVRVRLDTAAGTIVEGRTAADGSFRSPVIEQGEYVVRLFKQGFYRNVTRETVGESTQLNQTMVRGTTNVEFRVVDRHFSPPKLLSDARIEVSNIGSQRLVAGTVTFTLPVNTRYTVTATKAGYTTTEKTVFVGERGEERTFAISREPALNLTAASDRVVVGETVEVTVRNAYAEPVEGATVTVGGESVATTGAEGTATVAIETAGPVPIVASTDTVTSNEITVRGVATATATPEPTPTATPTPTVASTPGDGSSADGLPDVGQPGFTPVAAVLALLVAALLVGRRR